MWIAGWIAIKELTYLKKGLNVVFKTLNYYLQYLNATLEDLFRG